MTTCIRSERQHCPVLVSNNTFLFWQTGHILQIGSISKFEDHVEDILEETGDTENVEIKYK